MAEVAAELVVEAQAEHHLQPAARQAQPPRQGRRVQPQHLHPAQPGPALQGLVLQGLVQIRTRRRHPTSTMDRPLETLRARTPTAPRPPNQVQIAQQRTAMA